VNGLLLDEHLSPKIATGLQRMGIAITVHSMNEWNGGRFLGRTDHECLAEAARQGLTLVTYDVRSIPRFLKGWRDQGLSHAGVIYVDQRTIRSGDIGALVQGLARLIREFSVIDWTNRQEFLRHA
jgi:hypothetical protein